jgi:glycosyltransferase involved in cell wall biosynthesis
MHVIPPPFEANLPPGNTHLEGEPAVVLVGGGWLPNRDSVQWYLTEVWDHVRSSIPEASSHVFGGPSFENRPGVEWHEAPSSSRDLFCRDSILAVPLRVASGIRIKILEAWARGIPVVATPEAADGLGAEHGTELLLARTAAEFADALRRLGNEPGLRQRLVKAGRDRLRHRYNPVVVGDQIEALYESTVSEFG